jgi:acetoin utilization deacetylase AcuC-like enzyme
LGTWVFQDVVFLDHDPGPEHPESPARLEAIADALMRAPLAGVESKPARPATEEEILRVHDAAHIARLATLAGRTAALDPDTLLSPGSHHAALCAAGAAVDAVTAVLRGDCANAFVLSRPPGHHAERRRAMGFCLLNNVAIAAEAARALGAQRVAIIDWDVHHGNGTQNSFWGRNDVLFVSTHEEGNYPGTGAAAEIGSGEGRGFTVNCPLPPGQSDADYGAVFESLILPVANAFNPELVLVSAGFDAHAADPLGGMNLTERGFAAMTSALGGLASGKVVLVLEGGYHLGALAGSVHACLEVLRGRKESFPRGAPR